MHQIYAWNLPDLQHLIFKNFSFDTNESIREYQEQGKEVGEKKETPNSHRYTHL